MNSISIVLCTCNGERFLDEQLTTLRQQEGVDEIFVADDRSTDDTMSILHEHALADSRIRISRSERRLGVTQNFQRALRLARGDWLALADQDDIWLPKKIATLRGAWDGEAVLVHHATHKFSRRPSRAVPSPAGESRKFFGNDVRRLLYRNTVVGHTTLIRADIVRQLMPFPQSVPYDWWLGVGATLYGGIQYVDEYLVHYRIHDRNAYHPTGSRFARLRAEHELRLNLLSELERTPRLSGSARDFVRGFHSALAAAETTRVPWRLGQFYLQHATLFFAGPDRRLSRWKRLRKSVTAMCGAIAHRTVSTVWVRPAPPRISVWPRAAWWSLGVGLLSAISLLAMWPSRAHTGETKHAKSLTAETAILASEKVQLPGNRVLSKGTEEFLPPLLYLLRHDGRPRLTLHEPPPRGFRGQAKSFGLPPPGFGAPGSLPTIGLMKPFRIAGRLSYFRGAEPIWPGHFHPALLHRYLQRPRFGPHPSGIPYAVWVRRPVPI